jgi:transposase
MNISGNTSGNWREERRLRALALYNKGWQQKLIAEALGVTKGAVSQWLKKTKDLPEERQKEALRIMKSPGRPPVIAPEERPKLVALIERGAAAFGFVGDVWTANRVRAVARRELGIQVGLSTIKTFLHEEGFSVQKPEVTASQKREKAVAGFRGGWVNLKKGPSAPAPR